MNPKMLLLALQSLPVVIKTLKIIARLVYPLLRPRLKQLVNDPDTTHDEDFMDILDSGITGTVKKRKNELPFERGRRKDKAKLKRGSLSENKNGKLF